MSNIAEKVYVINMVKDKHRLERFKAQIGDMFDYTIVKGVDPVNDNRYRIKYEKWAINNIKDVTKENFDWKHYLLKYPDLIKNGVLTKDHAWEHWTTVGKKELRSCNRDNDIINKGQWGCLYSHINIIIDAIKNNYSSILIFEDDIITTRNIQEKVSKMREFIDKHPNWNIIYLGASQHGWNNIKFKNGYYYAKKTKSTFAYMVKREIYSVLLDEFAKMNKPVDDYLVDIQKKYYKSIYVIYPNIFISNLEESNIGEKRSNEEYYKLFRWEK